MTRPAGWLRSLTNKNAKQESITALDLAVILSPSCLATTTSYCFIEFYSLSEIKFPLHEVLSPDG